MDITSLREHYERPDLTTRILEALAAAGIDTDQLTCADLELLDEFHLRGHAATSELAALAQLQPKHEVLDLGCGLGGPARHLAAAYGCQVVGLDLAASNCAAATELTQRVGLSDRVRFRQGDMRQMPFADAAFDRVWLQHSLLNIPDKAALVREVRRVLRPHGKLVLHEVCAGSGAPVHLPVPWATEPGHSHLVGAAEMRSLWEATELRPEIWQDVTGITLDWLDGLAAGLAPKAPNSRPRPGLGLVMGPNAGLKSRNLGRNLREGRVVVVWGVFAV